ncbi:MAG: response regulator [Anaerolineae bacterium]
MEEKPSILIVDNNISHCKTLSFILGRRGYAVTTAKDGPEAIAHTQEKAYDAIFIDVKLPTLNGLETYLAIRESNPEAAVVMMTVYRQEMAELVGEALDNDACICLHKPLDLAKVLRLVDEIQPRMRK